MACALAPPSAAQSFAVFPTPNPLDHRNLLRAVDGVALNDVWAVGDGMDEPYGQNRQFILHWDGAVWSEVPVPHHNDFGMHDLFGVAAGAPDLAWAVGLYGEGGGRAVPQVLRWDGQTWTVDNIPEIYSGSLMDVFVLSADDVWAVGEDGASGVRPPLVLHWDGSSWSRVPVPPVADRSNSLEAVHASAPDNVWAVGDMRFVPLFGFVPLVMRWDGSEWENVPLPDGLIGTVLDVVTFGPDDTRVTLDPMAEGYPPLVLHWDGDGWTSYELAVGSFAAISPAEVYGFGSEAVYLWDGKSWSLYQTLTAGPNASYRGSASILDDGSLWVVGRTVVGEGNDAVFRTLAVRGVAKSYLSPTSTEPRAEGARLALSAPHPNPTAGPTALTLALAEHQPVRVEVFDVVGRRVLTLHDGVLPAGASHELALDAGVLPSGTYVVRATGEREATYRRVTVVR